MSEECHLHEGRFFDPERRQWGYEVYCSNEAPHECTGERELFRVLDSVVANASARPEGLDFRKFTDDELDEELERRAREALRRPGGEVPAE